MIKNPLEKEKPDLLVPILIGAAAAAAIAYLFVTESGSEVRGKLTENLNKGWDSIKDNIPVSAEDITALKDKVVDAVSGAAGQAKDTAGQA